VTNTPVAYASPPLQTCFNLTNGGHELPRMDGSGAVFTPLPLRLRKMRMAKP